MLTVSLFIELIRSSPRTVFWAAALGQAVLWVIVPALFFSAPPGDTALVLAVGHEFRLGTDFGPPLAYWLAEIFFSVGGMFAVYLLSQICVVTALWAVFSLGSAIAGQRHAVMAVLLLAGVWAFTLPTAEFGPAMLVLPLWSLALLFYWRAVGEDRRVYWFALGLDIGLLLLTAYASLALVGLLLVYAAISPRGRAQFTNVEPWIAAIIAVLMMFPYLIWLDQNGGISLFGGAFGDNLRLWGRGLLVLLAGHFGLALLIVLAWGVVGRDRATPEIVRSPIEPEANAFVYFFALGPALVIGLPVLIAGRAELLNGPALVVLSGLAVIVAAPDRIRIVHQQLTGVIWGALLFLPPLLTAAVVVLLPWTLSRDVSVGYPAKDLGQFFADNFQRRTGRPLPIVAGDLRTAALVALGAPERPSLYLDATPERSPWVSRSDIAQKGAVVVWPTADTSGTPPAAIRERFPDLVPEVPHAFARRFRGFLPLLRIGWAVVRPRGEPAPPAGATRQ